MTATCQNCNVTHRVEQNEDGSPALETWPCQGSDTCLTRMCDDCRRTCFNCGLSACNEHLAPIDGEPWCEICRADLAKAEATDYTLAGQNEARFAQALAAAGCTLAEAQALGKLVM